METKYAVLFLVVGIVILPIGMQLFHAYLTNPFQGFGASPTQTLAYNKSNDLIGAITCGILSLSCLGLGILLFIGSTRPLSWRHGKENFVNFTSTQVSNNPALGVIRNIEAGLSFIDLFIYPDAFVVTEGSYRDVMIRAVGGSLGGFLGSSLANRIGNTATNSSIANKQIQTANSLANLNKKNSLIPIAAIESAQISQGSFSDTLLCTLSDGSTGKFSWNKQSNNYTTALALLQHVLGNKLQLT